jgi:cyclophilin family peptidyl-prolyl cis-trans isomerase/HEAT repeat protein
MRTSVATHSCAWTRAAEITRWSGAAAVLATIISCATVPPPPPAPIVQPFEEKLSSIVKLEDERRLREPAPPPPPAEPPVRGRRAAPAPPPPPSPPDLVRMLSDPEARVRRRAALAIGRVGLREGVQPLISLQADQDPEVRQMAAFAIGLIGDASGRDALVTALSDPSPLVKGSAAEALGLIGDAAAADAIGRMAADLVAAGAVAQVPGEEDDSRRDTPAAALRLAIFSLVRLKAYAPLASVVLDQAGEPRVRWWPVAFAFQRLEDPRGKTALTALLRESHPYTRAFAAKGLGGLKDPSVLPLLVPLVSGPDRMVAVEAIRAIGRLGGAAAGPALLALIQNSKADPYLRLEAVSAAASVPAASVPGLDDSLLDTLADPSGPVRAAVLRTIAQRDAETFTTVLSGLDSDGDWSVRATLATILGTLTPQTGLPRLKAMLEDPDQRVIPAVLGALARLKAPDAASVLQARLKADDPVVRAAAARGLAELKATDSSAALAQAYRDGQRDTTYIARAAALGALAELRTPDAVPLLTEALNDKDWAVRVRAAALLKPLDSSVDVEAKARPAPTSRQPDFYDASRLVSPPVSTQFYIDTDRGSVQFELAVLDAPLTVDNFVMLARRGFFDGLSFHRVVPAFVVQSGDPRGDGEGGPGYTIRDELNQRPYVRGTLGMALDWADTGGSQFFITQSPQPHLDAKYTVFGRVLSGMDVIDRIQPGDVIRRVRIWDGTQ